MKAHVHVCEVFAGLELGHTSHPRNAYTYVINTVDDIYLMSGERHCLLDSTAAFDNIHISYRALSLFSGGELLTNLPGDGD